MSDNTYTYSYTDPNGGTDNITVTVDPSTLGNTNDPSGTEQVTSVSGTIDGQAITGLVGGAGPTMTSADGAFTYDNDIVTSGNNADGAGGSLDGIDNSGLYVTAGGVNYNFYAQGGAFYLQSSPGSGTYSGGVVTSPVVTNAPCFCPGTLIATPGGEVAVETLAVGDLVTTVAGGSRAIRWIGRRAVATRFADPLTALPVRIRAGAIDTNVPARDSLLSPCHAILVDGVLAQAGALVNGTSIVRETAMPESFTYYHVELADHALILADGLPAETFIDNIGRMAFDNWEEHQALVGADAEITAMDLPRAKSARQVPSAIRARLAQRAACGLAAAA